MDKREILEIIAKVSGCDGSDDYARGWDDACRAIEEEIKHTGGNKKMKNKIYAEHRRLVKNGRYKKARMILQMLRHQKESTMLCKKPMEREVIKYAKQANV